MSSTPRILVVYAHPAHHHSRVNRRMFEAAQSVPNVRMQDLYETYPDFNIDAQHEQSLLAEAELIVFQHPLQWYSMPSLLKEWVDVVLQHGWAYGPGGTALQGKDFWMVATTGGQANAYQENAYHGYSFNTFLAPIRQTAVLCGMRWLAPLIFHGARHVDSGAVEAHVAYYRHLLSTYPAWPANSEDSVFRDSAIRD